MVECFFFVEKEKEDDLEGFVRALCLKCRSESPAYKAWFYSGSVGPWDVKCVKCNAFIHRHKEIHETE